MDKEPSVLLEKAKALCRDSKEKLAEARELIKESRLLLESTRVIPKPKNHRKRAPKHTHTH